MTESEAVNIAKKHLDQMNRNNPYSEKMSWVLTECIEYDSGFYFRYKFELVNPKEDIAFGGAPGFLVFKMDSSVKDLSWGELNKLKNLDS